MAQHARSFRQIPGPKGFLGVGAMFGALKGGALSGRLHLYISKQHNKYGPIYREQIGAFKFVSICDPNYVEKLFRREEKYPRRTELKAWKLYREENNIPTGVVLSEGKCWQRHRTALNKYLMRPAAVVTYSPVMKAVTSDLIEKIKDKRDIKTGYVHDLQDLLFLWSLEASCVVLFGIRLGCLNQHPPNEITDFIQAVQTILTIAEQFFILKPDLAKRLHLPLWRKNCDAWDVVFRTGTKCMGQSLISDEEARSGIGVLCKLMQEGHLSPAEITASIIDVMMAAVDTTSATCLWALYLLAVNQNKQHSARKSINASDNSSYMKGVRKETLRMFPVAPVLSRILSEDLVIGNYCVPAETVVNIPLYTMGRDRQIFHNPDTFLPERWTKETNKSIHPFSNLPFGFGTRSCIGRRLAECEIEDLLCQVLEKFSIHLSPSQELLTGRMSMLLGPEERVKLQFTPCS